MPQTTRVLVTTASVLGLYFAYSFVAVPFIEPSGNRLATKRGNRSAQPPPNPLAGLNRLFDEGDWELDNPKVLETGKGVLLFDDYHNRPDGRVEIRPCTIILFPTGESKTEADRWRGAIVMRAVEGALLEFDEPLNLVQAKIGKLVGGRIVGPVLIHSDYKAPGPDDDLDITARDLTLTTDKITSSAPLVFRFGANRGRGKDLAIELADSAAKGSPTGVKASGVKSFSLLHEVELELDVGEFGAGDDGSLQQYAPRRPLTPDPRPPTPSMSSPLFVTCDGPFRFDLETNTATLTDSVLVVRALDGGAEDRLERCDRLEVQFDSEADAQPGRGKLKPRRLVATGKPVVIVSPSAGLDAAAEQIEYDVADRSVALFGREEAVLRLGKNEVHAFDIQVRPGAAGELGQMQIKGAGWIEGDFGEAPPRPFAARWTKALEIKGEAPEQIIALAGAAEVRFGAMGAIGAELIHLWLIAAPADAAAVAAAGPLGGRLVPDRLQASGSVWLDSAQLEGRVETLQAWFENPTAPAGADSAIPRQGEREFAIADDPPDRENPPTAKGKLNLRGRLLQVQVVGQGETSRLDQVVLDGNAELVESLSATPGDRPLVVKGARVMINQPGPDLAHVTVIGRPAHVEARGLVLEGDEVVLDKLPERIEVEIDGGGRMVVPIDRDLDGRATTDATPLEILWTGGMRFDGQVARFRREVAARRHAPLNSQLLRTETMDVRFLSPVTVGDVPSQARPELDRVECRDGVFLERHSFDDRGPLSHERLWATDMTLDQRTGDLESHGPGAATIVRRGAPATPLSLPGRTPADAADEVSRREVEGLTYVAIEFERSLVGNRLDRELTFSGRTRTIYGPVITWDQTLDREQLGPDDVTLEAERLVVRQMEPVAGGKPFVELDAEGNTITEAHDFFARASRIGYSQEKDLLVLEGLDRTNAELYHESGVPGTARSRAAARKILYSRSTRSWQVVDSTGLDLTRAPGERPRE